MGFKADDIAEAMNASIDETTCIDYLISNAKH